jgi:hypothetical protein
MSYEKNLMGDICRLRNSTTARVSSWDTSGGNSDWTEIKGGETAVLADISGPGCIRHIYFTVVMADKLFYRDCILRMFWDNEETPSVEVPLGDFFCVSNCTVRDKKSLMVTINPGINPNVSMGYNCYFPMPFAERALIEIENQNPNRKVGALGGFWYHIDYEQRDSLDSDVGRFHAQFRRENPTVVKGESALEMKNMQLWDGKNIGGEENYIILEAKGHGQVVGLHLQIDNVVGGWYGEGDDMIFIDGDKWPPRIHGTGSEEIFGGGACPSTEYAGPYTGYHLIENPNFSGKNAMYRWYLHDPIRFKKSIKMGIEHGHANNFENDYASVVYWYQSEPHHKFPSLPGREDRFPVLPEIFWEIREIRDTIIKNHITLYRDPSKWEMYFEKINTDFYRFEEDYNNNKFDKLKSLSEEIIKLQQNLMKS